MDLMELISAPMKVKTGNGSVPKVFMHVVKQKKVPPFIFQEEEEEWGS